LRKEKLEKGKKKSNMPENRRRLFKEKNIVIGDMRAIQGQAKERDLDTLTFASFKKSFNEEIAREQTAAGNAVTAGMAALALAGSGVSGDS
jgi:hypothetical protein